MAFGRRARRSCWSRRPSRRRRRRHPGRGPARTRPGCASSPRSSAARHRARVDPEASTVQIGCSGPDDLARMRDVPDALIEPRGRVGGRHRSRGVDDRLAPDTRSQRDGGRELAPAGREVEAEQRRAGGALHQLHGGAVARVDLQDDRTVLGAGRSRSRSDRGARTRASARPRWPPTSFRAAAPASQRHEVAGVPEAPSARGAARSSRGRRSAGRRSRTRPSRSRRRRAPGGSDSARAAAPPTAARPVRRRRGPA